MTADLLALRDWLLGLGVTHVATEATGVYWKPVYYLLEDDFELLLVNAQHVKNGPGQSRPSRPPGGVPSGSTRVYGSRASSPPSRSASCATSPAIASRWCGSVPVRQTACTRCSRTPTSSSTAS